MDLVGIPCDESPLRTPTKWSPSADHSALPRGPFVCLGIGRSEIDR